MTTRKSILDEIASGRASGSLGYLNNFFSKLPGGFHRQIIPENELDICSRKRYHGERHNHSDLFLDQSPRVFYATIDSVVEQCGLDPVKIRTMQEEKNDRRELNNYAQPAYVELRLLGYNHHDLTS